MPPEPEIQRSNHDPHRSDPSHGPDNAPIRRAERRSPDDDHARELYDALDQVDFLLWMIRGIRSGSTEPADSSPITVSDRHCRERQRQRASW